MLQNRHTQIVLYMYGMYKPRRFFINYKPMLIVVTCRVGYQFISILSSLFLFIYLFCLPNKLYIIIWSSKYKNN